jgi:hypothetical protein
MAETAGAFILNVKDRINSTFNAILAKPTRCPLRSFGHAESAVIHVNLVDSVAGNLSKKF